MIIVADVWCILFWVQLIAFVGIIICLVCWYESELKEAEKRRINDILKASSVNRYPHICYKDRLLQKKNQELRLAYIRIIQLEKSKKKK